MYNKELFKKICNASCTMEELKNFVIGIDKKEFDLDKPFEKYYDVQKILYAIQRYENKEIDDSYLSYWMNAYDWIIMGGFKIEAEDESVTFKEWIEWEIADWLDSLSFFDDSDNWFNLDGYKNSFKVIDKIYKSLNDWEPVFAHTDEWGDNEDDVVILVHNSKDKEFVKIFGELDYLHQDVKFKRVELDELEKEIIRLKQNGYQELKYSIWDEESNSK